MSRLTRSGAMALGLVGLTLTLPILAQQPDEWVRPFPAFKLIGNVYWVGTFDLSTFLITTSEGHILVNTGLASTVPQIQAGVEQLGFKFADVKILLATHAHWDHAAGLAELKRRTKARMMMAEADAPVLESGGKADFRWGKDPQAHFEPVTVDRRLKNQDTIALGGVTLTAHHHPGHTQGATSFTLTVREGGRDYRVIIANLGSINPGVSLLGMPGYPAIGADYARTFAAQKAMSIDVFLASHASQFRMHEKYKPGDGYDPNRFVDSAGFQSAVDDLEKTYLAQLQKERAGKKR